MGESDADDDNPESADAADRSSEWWIDIEGPAMMPADAPITLVIRVRKLTGGTPVTVEFPIPEGLIIEAVSSTRGTANMVEQMMIFDDELHVGEEAVITLDTLLSPDVVEPMMVGQACIVTPVSLCDGVTLRTVVALPLTGETPRWRTPILLAGALLAVSIGLGAARILYVNHNS